MDTLIEKLKKAGLSGNESKVYLELLRRGPISANDISKKLGMDRTLAYQVLNNLIEKGLVSHIIKESKKHFDVINPENLLIQVKEKEKFIESLIPELNKIEKIKENKQEINVYEGKQGLKVLLEDMIKSKELCVFGATGKSYDILKYFMPGIEKKAQKLGLTGRMITSDEFRRHKMTAFSNLDIRYLEAVKSPATTTIYGDKVAIHVLTDKPTVIIIKNKEISDSYRSYFEFLWIQGQK
ncbi:MAG: hypothetical protein GQ477_01210 [Nanohaloarchaea archaeon]|nr:hypothetical protein [Candidatus Nanohaloarchaea archaeon]